LFKVFKNVCGGCLVNKTELGFLIVFILAIFLLVYNSNPFGTTYYDNNNNNNINDNLNNPIIQLELPFIQLESLFLDLYNPTPVYRENASAS
jgi:hypothetical protein